MTSITDRRRFLKEGVALVGAANALALGLTPLTSSAQTSFTEWGYPQPYRQVSTKSVEWLKSKGWWPLQVAWNPLWSDGNVTMFTMQKYELLKKRGIEAEFPQFLVAGLMNEAYVPGRIQVAHAGSLGLLRVIDLKVPTIALLAYPAQRQGFVVRIDSPIRNGFQDLKGQRVLKRPAVLGTPIGSATHQGLLVAARVLGLQEGKDFVLKNAGLADILAMPDGFDGFLVWEPNLLMMTEVIKNARIVELIDNYLVFNGYSYMRGEIEQNAPDVVQAYTDAFVEARLLARQKSAEVLAAFAADSSQRGRDPKLIARDAEIHVFNPKPTVNYPDPAFWIPLEVYQAGVMSDAGVLKRKFTEADFAPVLKPAYLANTYTSLGWNVPKQPAFLPADWKGKATNPPYPPYGIMQMGQQPFPEPKDLNKAWMFNGKAYTPG
jgi:ABC-type nitrate/sulfonate/bicarbonate transport system substrate-binding protein